MSVGPITQTSIGWWVWFYLAYNNRISDVYRQNFKNGTRVSGLKRAGWRKFYPKLLIIWAGEKHEHSYLLKTMKVTRSSGNLSRKYVLASEKTLLCINLYHKFLDLAIMRDRNNALKYLGRNHRVGLVITLNHAS